VSTYNYAGVHVCWCAYMYRLGVFVSACMCVCLCVCLCLCVCVRIRAYVCCGVYAQTYRCVIVSSFTVLYLICHMCQQSDVKYIEEDQMAQAAGQTSQWHLKQD